MSLFPYSSCSGNKRLGWMTRIVSSPKNDPAFHAIGFCQNTRTGRGTCLSHRPSDGLRSLFGKLLSSRSQLSVAKSLLAPALATVVGRRVWFVAIVYCIYFTRVLDGTHHHHGEQPTLSRTAGVLQLNSFPATTHFAVLLRS